MTTSPPVETPELPPTDGAADDAPSARIMAWVQSDPQLAGQCAAAVDVLEVAARLETHGVSSRVAVDTFGYPDVFAAAEAVYAELPFAVTEPPAPDVPPMGAPMDLLRGALYALPALFLPVVVVGFDLHPAWWVLPIGLTVAWGIGQAFATCAWALLARKDQRSDAFMACASIVVSAALCLGASAVAWWALGGNTASALLAVGIAVYLAASGILLFQEAERVLAVCMVPAAVGSFFSLGLLPVSVSHRTAAWCVTSTVALSVVAANRYLFSARWRRPVLGRTDRIRAAKFLAYGTGSGLLLSAFIAFSGDLDGTGRALIIAGWPLLLTLGLMEWQLRSFRSRASTALVSSVTLGRFAHRVRSAFLRSVGLYVLALGLLSAVGIAVGSSRHAAYVPLLIGTVGALGVCFFLALLLASAGRINLVLACWAATFGLLAVELVAIGVLRGHVTPLAGLVALLAATASSIVLLSVVSSRALISPLSY